MVKNELNLFVRSILQHSYEAHKKTPKHMKCLSLRTKMPKWCRVFSACLKCEIIDDFWRQCISMNWSWAWPWIICDFMNINRNCPFIQTSKKINKNQQFDLHIWPHINRDIYSLRVTLVTIKQRRYWCMGWRPAVWHWTTWAENQ